MAIIAKDTSENRSVNLPSAGLHKSVCCDVHDLGAMETQWGPKIKVLVVWELDEKHPDFEGPHRVNKRYSLSLHEKSNLGQDLESWRGKAFTEKERREGFDLEKLIGKSCILNIVHNETDKGTYPNVRAVFPLQKGEKPMEISKGYTRIKDRKDDKKDERKETNGKAEDLPDEGFPDDLPF